MSKSSNPTISQAISQTLKTLGLTQAVKRCPDEDLQVHMFETVCRYLDQHKLDPDHLQDIDWEAAGEDHTGYTIGAQIADVYLTEFAQVLEIEPGDFGAEDFYKVGEQLWDAGYWED